MQIFAEKRPDSSEEIFAVFYFRGTRDALTTPLPVDATSSERLVGILYSRRLILLYSNHLEGIQTVENHHVHMGTILDVRM